MSVDPPRPEPNPAGDRQLPLPDDGPAGRPTVPIQPARIRHLRERAASGTVTEPVDPSVTASFVAPVGDGGAGGAGGPADPGADRVGGDAGADPRRGRPNRRRRRTAALLVALLALLLGASGLAVLPRVQPDASADGAGVVGADGADGADPSAGSDGSEDGEIDLDVAPPGTLPGFALGDAAGRFGAVLDSIEIDGLWPGGGPSLPQPPAQPQPDPPAPPQPERDGGGAVDVPPDPVDPDSPAPDADPADPCSGLEPGAHLVTTPDPKHLAPGVTASSVTIRNCGAASVDWTAATKPSVSLAAGAGTLGAGATQSLAFTIDASAFAADSIVFKIRVSEPGFNQYVDIHATKAGFTAPGPTPPDPGATVSSGGPTGCAAQCITKATLVPNASSPNLGIDVSSTVAARFGVFVSTSPAIDGPDGQPAFADGGLIAATADLGTVWHGLLSPLEPATDYHIIVRATDADGGVANRVGTFRSATPAVDPGLGEAVPGGDSGCATQCITKAWLTPDTSSFDMALEVSSHTLARFEAYLTTDEPSFDAAGNPVLDGLAPMTANFAYETAWTSRLSPLEPGASYTVIVRATDGMLRSSYRVGSFETRAGADQMMVTLHEIRVSNDADHVGKGELSFSMIIDGTWVAATGEHKIRSGTTVNLNDGDRYPGLSRFVEYHDGPGSWLPSLEVVAFERDGDGLVEFCSASDNPAAATGHDDGCDWKWNTAGTGLVTSVAELVPCPELGIDAVEFAGDRCVAFESTDEGDDVPRFSAVASFRPLTG